MSKAEEEAIKRYPKVGLYDNMMKRKGFIEGYNQAAKDLELTWEDVWELYIIIAEVDTEIELCKTDIKSETIGYYLEILKRYKERRKK